MSSQKDTSASRRTSRVNAGKFGERYGNYVNSTKQKKMDKSKPSDETTKISSITPAASSTPTDQPPSSTSIIPVRQPPSTPRPPGSLKSFTSAASSTTLRKAEIQNEVDNKIAKLEKSVRDKFQLLDNTNLKLAIEEDAYRKHCSEPNAEAFPYPATQKEVIRKLKDEIAQLEIDIKYEVHEVATQKRLLQSNADVEKQRVEEEDDGNMSDKMRNVGAWASNSVQHISNKSSSEMDQDSDDETRSNEDDNNDTMHPKDSMADLRHRFKMLKSDPTQKQHKPTSNSRKKKKTSPQDNSSSAIEKLTQALVDALKTDKKSSPTDKLLARQVQGRDLPIFSGKAEEWPAFHAAYQNSSTNCGYTNADNLPRLQKCLKGDAQKTVQCMLLNAASVPAAIAKLEKRFGQPEIIINSLVKKTREVSPVKTEKLESYVEFGLLVDDLTSTIINLGCLEHLANPVLLTDLVKKLPSWNQVEWARYISTNKSKPKNLQTFSEWWSDTTDALYAMCPPATEPPKFERNQKSKKSDRVYSTSEKTRSNPNQRKPKKCVFCGDLAHQSRECKTFTTATVDQRWELVKEKKACYGCLNLGHRFHECRSKRPCNKNGCEAKHHQLLHQDKKTRVLKSNEESQSEEEKEEVQNIEQIQFSHIGGKIGYMVCPVLMESANGPVEGYVVLDSLSSITSMSDATAKQLGLSGPAEPLSIKGINSTARYPHSEKFQLQIHHKEENASFTLQVKTMPKLDLPRQTLPPSVLTKYHHLQGLGIQPYDEVRPTVIIGMDHPHLHVHLEHRIGKSNKAPIAVRTKLGWMVIGNLSPYERQEYAYLMREEDDLHHIVKDFLSNESFGTLATTLKPRNKEDVRAQSILDSTLRRFQHGWEVGLLWRDDNVNLPDSKPLALHRLMQMERKMDRNPDFATAYQNRINEYEAKGFARKLTPEEAMLVTPKTNYLPHFMAYNPKKPTKLRFVFDAAAKVRGRSLNDHLLQGPDKMASLPGILLKFRQRQIGITADIEDMFHRVHVRPEDAQAQRFLWRGMDRNREPEVYQMSVLIFGATCSPSCAQEAKDRNAAEFEQQFPAACKCILYKHYVDDLLDSTTTIEEAIQLQQQTCEIQMKGGFKLRNWLSNSVQVMQNIPEDLRASSMKT